MTRISTLSQNQAVVLQMLRAQSQVAETQRQVSTGEIAGRYSGMARDAGALISAKAVEARTLKFIDLGRQVVNRTDFQANGLTVLYESTSRLRQSLLVALANNSGRTVASDVNTAFDSARSVLNTRVGGSYIYAGSRTDTLPFNAASLAGLANAANPIASYFDNDTNKAQVRVDQNLMLEYGIVASDMGQDLMGSIKALAEYNTATPFAQYLTPADRALLESQIAGLDTIMSQIGGLQASNGIVQNRLESIITRHEDTDIVNKRLIADISEVDMAEAISRLNQDQVAVEASYKLIQQLNKVSLLNFI